MATKRPRKGHIVEAVFLDHVEDGDELMECTVYGRLAETTPQEYKIDSWCCSDSEAHENNKKRFIIARKMVSSIVVLK